MSGLWPSAIRAACLNCPISSLLETQCYVDHVVNMDTEPLPTEYPMFNLHFERQGFLAAMQTD